MDEKQLFDELVLRLKGKSVYKTLKKVEEGKATPVERLKGLFSLGTHVCIECESDDRYRSLLLSVYDRIGRELMVLVN